MCCGIKVYEKFYTQKKKWIGTLAANPYVLGLSKCMGTRDKNSNI